MGSIGAVGVVGLTWVVLQATSGDSGTSQRPESKPCAAARANDDRRSILRSVRFGGAGCAVI
jgi:hypothetical protein